MMDCCYASFFSGSIAAIDCIPDSRRQIKQQYLSSGLIFLKVVKIQAIIRSLASAKKPFLPCTGSFGIGKFQIGLKILMIKDNTRHSDLHIENKLPINLCALCTKMTFMRVESLNIFRFIAAIIIINFHFTHLYPGFLTSGPEMVTFFFVLSGVVLILAYYDKENFSSKNFFIRRIIKLYPSYLVALAMVIAWYSTIPLDISIEKSLLNLLALQAWFPSHPLDLNFPAWAISVEVFFICHFQLYCIYLKRIG